MISKETLKKAVKNVELLKALAEWERMREIAKRLFEIARRIEEFGVNEGAISVARKNIEKYKKIRGAYGIFIERAFGIPWRYWRLILKYRNASDEEIDNMSVEALCRKM